MYVSDSVSSRHQPSSSLQSKVDQQALYSNNEKKLHTDKKLTVSTQQSPAVNAKSELSKFTNEDDDL